MTYFKSYRSLEDIDMTNQAKDTLEEIIRRADNLGRNEVMELIEEHLRGESDAIDEDEAADYLHMESVEDIAQECGIELSDDDEEEDDDEEV